MKTLVLHIGPGKCGSSSIQEYFNLNKKTTKEKVSFVKLKPMDIKRFNSKILDSTDELMIEHLLKKNGKYCDVLILSHEYLYQCPLAIANIFENSKNNATKNIVLGYSRRQSDFYVSAYSQWFFRSEKSISEVNTIFSNEGINSSHFIGIEKHLIAAIATDFKIANHFFDDNLMNWNVGYKAIQASLKDAVIFKIGTLPKSESNLNLIEDFIEKAGLNLKKSTIPKTKVKTNTKFSSTFVEALNVATEFGLEVPSANQDNKLLIEISNSISANDELDQDFLNELKSYIDYCFQESNREFCNRFQIDTSYFKATTVYEKTNIMELIKKKENERKSNTYIIDYYRKISGIMASLNLSIVRINKHK